MSANFFVLASAIFFVQVIVWRKGSSLLGLVNVSHLFKEPHQLTILHLYLRSSLHHNYDLKAIHNKKQNRVLQERFLASKLHPMSTKQIHFLPCKVKTSKDLHFKMCQTIYFLCTSNTFSKSQDVGHALCLIEVCTSKVSKWQNGGIVNPKNRFGGESHMTTFPWSHCYTLLWRVLNLPIRFLHVLKVFQSFATFSVFLWQKNGLGFRHKIIN